VEWLESVECGFRSTSCTGEEEHVEEERDRGSEESMALN
jgi:hypothetical protein